MKDFSSLENKIGVEFKNKDLLIQAFVHRSYLNENPDFYLFHNERLEFLGDAVLELAVTRPLYDNYPDKSEGELTTWRAALVNSKMLAIIAKDIELNDFLLLSKGEIKETGKARDYILANTVEALIGAIYLDWGFDKAEKFVKTYVLSKLDYVLENGLFQDSKSKFQEMAQEKAGVTPTYNVIKEWGPDHTKQFIVGAYLQEELIAEGKGSSKHEAEEAAAKKSLEKKNW